MNADKLAKNEKKLRAALAKINTGRQDWPRMESDWRFLAATVREMGHLFNDREGLLDQGD
jgi:hypothetical protein